MHDFRGPSQDYVLSELDRRKGELRTQLVWIGAQKEPGYTSRVWKWVNGKLISFEPYFCHYSFVLDLFLVAVYFILNALFSRFLTLWCSQVHCVSTNQL